ncbi:MAG: M14 family metallopeptidase [Minisyncoccota bacterium]
MKKSEVIKGLFNKDGFAEYVGEESGPTSVILVGVHGNEQCGIRALEKILPTLKIKSGRVLFGYGNPKAIKLNVRYTKSNLNRMFRPNGEISPRERKSYEYSRAQVLKKYLDQSSALLDIHSSNTKESKPFLICEKNSKGLRKYLPFGLVVSGFDMVEPGGTDYYMNKTGAVGICAECGYSNDPSAEEVAEKTIKAFLAARRHINGRTFLVKQTLIKIYGLYKTTTNSFVLEKTFKDFERIKRNQLIGKDGEKEIRASKDSLILFARNRSKRGEEAFLLGSKKPSKI